jgi:hypothetical protein
MGLEILAVRRKAAQPYVGHDSTSEVELTVEEFRLMETGREVAISHTISKDVAPPSPVISKGHDLGGQFGGTFLRPTESI